jgi:RNA polymerase sigma-70 factor (ECF subfamily)
VESVNELASHEAPAAWGGTLSVDMDGFAERTLVRAAQTGELAAFEKLYRSKVGLVHAICLRMSGRAALAEELTQDVFVRAWEKLRSFRGESAFGTWLTRLTVNVVLSERRDRGRRDAHLTLAEDVETAADPVPPKDTGTAVDLERAIATLPEQARRVFVLHDVEGWNHPEIARFTGLAVGTCKSHLHRARKLLREVLAP